MDSSRPIDSYYEGGRNWRMAIERGRLRKNKSRRQSIPPISFALKPAGHFLSAINSKRIIPSRCSIERTFHIIDDVEDADEEGDQYVIRFIVLASSL